MEKATFEHELDAHKADSVKCYTYGDVQDIIERYEKELRDKDTLIEMIVGGKQKTITLLKELERSEWKGTLLFDSVGIEHRIIKNQIT